MNKSKDMPKVVLDTKGIIMHSYHRCNDKTSPLKDDKGEKTPRATAAFETFLSSYILDIFENHAPKDVIACYDSGNNRRRDLWPDYKKKRSEAKKDSVVEEQLDILYSMVKSFLAGMGCVQVSVPYTEADDVVAYVARNIRPYCTVYTVDKDLIQLSNETTMVYLRDEPVTEMTVKPSAPTEPYTVPPHLVALHKSIIGDSSDEYPGVKGMGHVAWLTMVDDFGIDGMEELDEIARNQDIVQLDSTCAEVDDGNLNKLHKAKYQWLLMYELARLHPEWCTGAYKSKMIAPKWFKRVPDTARAQRIIEQAGCMDVWPGLLKFLPQTVLITADNVDEYVYEGSFMDDLNDSIVSFDYETDDPNEYQNFIDVSDGKYVDVLSQEVCGASFTWGANLNKTVYICIDHKDTNNVPVSVISDILPEAEALVVQNAAFEQALTENTFGKEFVKAHLYAPTDTMIMSSYVDENEPSNLKMNSKQWLNYEQMTYKEVIGDLSGMSELTGEEVLDYGADDAIVTAHLYSLWDLIMQIEGTRDFCYDHEFLTTQVFHNSFMKGCRIDLARLKKMQDKDQAELDELMPKLRKLLENNCTESNNEAAAAYIAEIKPFEVAKMQDAEKSEEQISSKLAALTEEFTAGTAYVPYMSRSVPYDFKPTVKQFEDALKKLGVPDIEPHPEVCEAGDVVQEAWNEYEEFHLKSVAASRVTEWALAMRNSADQDDPEEAEMLKFVDLVAASCHQFKDRKGEEYAALKAYMIAIFPEKAKTSITGDELNFDSPKQMAQLLYGKLALPIRLYSKVGMDSMRDLLGFGGGPATNDKAMETALAEDRDGADDWRMDVLETVRSIKTLETKFKFYYNAYPLWVRPDDGRIHPAIKNCGTATRRPSGTSPNILQVKKGPIRSAYLPMEEGHVLIAPDFAGQELKLLASESGDAAMIDAFIGKVKKDLHSLTATAILPNIARKTKPELFKFLEFDTANKKAQSYAQFNAWRNGDEGEEKQTFANWLRDKRAKACNFLNNYGGGADTLSTNILVPREEAQEYLDDMDAMYPGIGLFKEESAKLGREQGYVSTAYGTRRHATPDILSKDNGKRLRMERQLGNARIQGCAADILKVVVSECETSGLWDETQSYLMAPVYDELVCSVPVEHAVEFCQRLQKIMDVTPPGHPIPMVSEFSIGFDWHNKIEIGIDTSEETVLQAIEDAKVKQVEFEEELAA